jgi:hypothetical protein
MSHKRLALTLTALLLAHRLLHAAFQLNSDSNTIYKSASPPRFAGTDDDAPSFFASSGTHTIHNSAILEKLYHHYHYHYHRGHGNPSATSALQADVRSYYDRSDNRGVGVDNGNTFADDDRILDDDPWVPPGGVSIDNDDDNSDDNRNNKDDEGAFSIDLIIYCIVMLILIVSTCMKECARTREIARRGGGGPHGGADDNENEDDDDDTEGDNGSDMTERARRRRRRRRMSPAERRAFIMKHLIVQTIPDPENDSKKKSASSPFSDNNIDANAADSDSAATRVTVVQSVMRKVTASMQREGTGFASSADTISPSPITTPNSNNDNNINSLTQPLLSDEEQAVATTSSSCVSPLVRDSDSSFISPTNSNSPDGDNNYYHCCTICLDEYAPGEEICFSKFNQVCNHHYHLKCMMSWLLTKQNAERDDACPICRANYLQAGASVTSASSRARASSSRRSRLDRERDRQSRRNSGSFSTIDVPALEDEDAQSLALHSV